MPILRLQGVMPVGGPIKDSACACIGNRQIVAVQDSRDWCARNEASQPPSGRPSAPDPLRHRLRNAATSVSPLRTNKPRTILLLAHRNDHLHRSPMWLRRHGERSRHSFAGHRARSSSGRAPQPEAPDAVEGRGSEETLGPDIGPSQHTDRSLTFGSRR
jgi:hypothetical protein